MKARLSFFSFLAGLLLSVSVHAHHSAAQYDFGQPVSIEGKVMHIDVANPHIDLVLELDNGDGTTREVRYEGHARNNVYRRGWRPGAINEGDTITISIAPMRTGEDGGYILEFHLADGRSF